MPVGAGRNPLKIHQPAVKVPGDLYLRSEDVPVEDVIRRVQRDLPAFREVEVEMRPEVRAPGVRHLVLRVVQREGELPRDAEIGLLVFKEVRIAGGAPGANLLENEE